MHVAILGPLEVRQDNTLLVLGGPKQRAVLAMLAIHLGEVVSQDRLIEAVWGNDLPANPSNTLQYQVAQLRKLLEDDPSKPRRLVTRSPGYLLESSTITVDNVEFERHVGAARSHLAVEANAEARNSIEAALRLWHGPALDEFRYEAFASAEADRLDAERVSAQELSIDIALAQGRHSEMIPLLEDLTSRYPVREGLWAQRMTALYRDGRQTEALRAYQDARGALVDAGIEPSAKLRDLEQNIIDQDADLDAPALSFDPSRTNLPTPTNRLIGRESAVADTIGTLSVSRLVTLVGSGGAGKTRLAIAVANQLHSRYRDGVWFVELDGLEEPELVPVVVGRTLGVKEDPAAEVVDTVAAALRHKSVLIVLDNCEHLAEAAGDLVETLLQRCPGLSVLATSQSTMNVSGEVVVNVPPLALPGETDSIYDRLDEVAAVALFLERSKGASGRRRDWTEADLAAVANIVSELDGMPLAVELAAARTRSMSLDEIARGLSDRFEILGRGPRTAPIRQQSLLGAVEWSVSLLQPPLLDALLRLSVFAGSYGVETAASVVGVSDNEMREVLAALVDRSLIYRVTDLIGSARYEMLETIRKYGARELSDTELASAQDAHLDTFASLVAESADGICGPDQVTWLHRLNGEYENIRAALAWSIAGGSIESGIRMGGHLGGYWDWTGHLKEAFEWYRRLDEAVSEPIVGLGAVQGWRAYLAWEFGDMDMGRRFGEQALETATAIGDTVDVILALSVDALLARSAGDLDAARVSAETIVRLATEAGNDWRVAWAYSALATIALVAKDLDAALSHAETTIEIFDRCGDQRGIAWGLIAHAHVSLDRDDLDAADAYALDALAKSVDVFDDRNISWCLEILADIARRRGEIDRSARLWGAAHPLREHRGLSGSPSKLGELDDLERALRSEIGDDVDLMMRAGRADPRGVVAGEIARIDRQKAAS